MTTRTNEATPEGATHFLRIFINFLPAGFFKNRNWQQRVIWARYAKIRGFLPIYFYQYKLSFLSSISHFVAIHTLRVLLLTPQLLCNRARPAKGNTSWLIHGIHMNYLCTSHFSACYSNWWDRTSIEQADSLSSQSPSWGCNQVVDTSGIFSEVHSTRPPSLPTWPPHRPALGPAPSRSRSPDPERIKKSVIDRPIL